MGPHGETFEWGRPPHPPCNSPWSKYISCTKLWGCLKAIGLPEAQTEQEDKTGHWPSERNINKL